MGKSIAANKKVSHQTPNDIVFSIFSKLPVKSLKRFEGTSKSWILLFENPYFKNMYRINFLSKSHSYYDGTSLLLHQNMVGNLDHRFYDFKIALYKLYGEMFESRVKIDMPNPLQDDYPGFFILGSSSVNGILCLFRYFMQNKLVVLWNPATKEFKVIPSSCVQSESFHDELHGFGYDHLKKDYKVIRRVIFLSRTHNIPGGIAYDDSWEIYSLKSNSWKELNVDMPHCIDNHSNAQVYMDGVCHWWGIRETNIYEAYLVSFTMSNEVFVTTPLPTDMDNTSGRKLARRHLLVLNGSIALISNYLETATFHISILGELGVKDSWTKLFIVGPLPDVEHPIGAGKKGHIFFRKYNNELVWCDLNTQKTVEIGLKAQRDFGQIIVYKESILRLEE